MSERMELETAIKRSPKSKVLRRVFVDWLMQHEEYDVRFALKVANRIAMQARNDRELQAAHNAMCEDSCFARLLIAMISQIVNRDWNDAIIMHAVPGWRPPVAKREISGTSFLPSRILSVTVGARWVLREVVEQIKFNSLLPRVADALEYCTDMPEVDQAGDVEQLGAALERAAKFPNTAKNL